jgi:HEAT repeat protein
MAKTLEPRFSKWSDLGKEKLIEDSIGTANLLLTKLNTEDHRETFLMRNLIEKITYAISTTFIKKLNEYKTNNDILTPNEVSLMAYLFGITKNPIGKDVLLELSYDDDIGVRSSALIALGKLNIDSADIDFINKVSQRLVEMANEHSDKKIYNKNIAFAFNNYIEESNIQTLLKLLENDFFGVRFLAADALKKYNNTYINYLYSVDLKESLFNNQTLFIAFLYSLENLSNENFKSIIEMILKMEPLDDSVKYNLIILLQNKSATLKDNEFTNWTNELIDNLKNNLNIKVK